MNGWFRSHSRVEWGPSGQVNYSVHRNIVDPLAVASATATEGDRRAGPGGRRPHQATLLRYRFPPPTLAGWATEPTPCLITSGVVHSSEGTSAPSRHGEERYRRHVLLRARLAARRRYRPLECRGRRRW